MRSYEVHRACTFIPTYSNRTHYSQLITVADSNRECNSTETVIDVDFSAYSEQTAEKSYVTPVLNEVVSEN